MKIETDIVGVHTDELKKSVAADLAKAEPNAEKGIAALMDAIQDLEENKNEDSKRDD